MNNSSINTGNDNSPIITIAQAVDEILPTIERKPPKETVGYLTERRFSKPQIIEIILDTCAINEFMRFFKEASWTLEEILTACRQQNESPDSYQIPLDEIVMHLKVDGLSIIEIIQILQKGGFNDLKKIAMALNGIPNYYDDAIYTEQEIETALEGLNTPTSEIQAIMDTISASVRDVE